MPVARSGRLLLTALSLSVPFAGTGGAAAAAVEPLVETLDNGLTIVVQEHRTAPVVTVQAWVKAGSTTEGDLTGAGLSHFLEHMLFKGTARRDVGRMGREVKSIGGHTNAYTSFDRTVYYINCDAVAVNTALDILTDVLNHAAFNPEEVEKEREVIVKEMNRGRDSPSTWASRMLFHEAYLRHPYRHPIIGYEAQLRAVTRADLVAYYERFYAPNNLALIIAGDVDGPAVMAEATRLWAGIPRRGLAEPARPTEPQQLAPRTATEERDAQLAHVAMGFHGPALASDDLFPIDVLSLILGGGRTSRLYRSVREAQALVYSISTFSYTPRDPGLFGIGFSCDPDKRDAAREAVLAEIEHVQQDGVDPAEVETAKRKVVAQYHFGRETATQLAESLGTGLVLAGDLHFDERYVAGIQAVTAADVQRIARRYLVEANRTVTSVVPRGARAVRAAAEGPGPVAMPAVHTLDNGVRVIVRENRTTPLFALRALVLGGLRSEDETNAGITNLMQVLLTKGTTRWNAAELAQVVESRGGTFGTWGGYNSWGVHARTLAADWAVACDVVDQMLLHPTFPDAELDRERAAVLASIRAQEESVQTVAQRRLRRELYPTHPYRWLTDGAAEVVARLTAADLRSHHRRLLDPARIVVAVSGAVDTAALLARLNKSIGRVPAPADQWPAPAPPTFVRHTGQIVRDERETAQTIILLAFPGITMADPRRSALDAIEVALNGQGGRLFQSLRDERGLAYSVGMFGAPGLERGFVAFYIATVAEHRAQALAGLWEEITRLRQDGLSATEIADARRVLLSQQARGLETNDDFAFSVGLDELYGLGTTYYLGLADRLDTLTPAVTQEVAAELFQREWALVVDVGPAGDAPAN